MNPPALAPDMPYPWIDPTRTRAPHLRPGIVERVELLASVQDVADARVLTVVAPAGFGKTTLLAQLTAREAGAAAWLTLDESDNDPVVMLSHLLEALDDGATAWAGGDDPADRGPIERLLLRRVIAALGRLSGPRLLVLDDLQAVSEQAAYDVISALVDRLPGRARLAIGSRSLPTPALPVGRWLASGVLAEIGPGRLAMSPHETRALLDALGVRLPDGQVDEIRRRTGGWPAAIYLVGMSIRGHGWRSLDGMHWGHETYVAEWLDEQVLAPLVAEDRDLLLRSSILERLNGELCDAVVGRTGSAGRLDKLSGASLFLAPHDADGHWFRCHPLLRDHLQRELEVVSPSLLPELHGRASEWFAFRGFTSQAVEHALSGGLVEVAEGLVAAAGKEMYERGEVATLRDWTNRLGREPVERRPHIAPVAAWVTALDGRPEEAERWIADAEAGDRRLDPGDGTASLASATAILRAMTCRDGPEAMLADAMAASEAEPAWSQWRPTVDLEVGYAHLMLGDLDEARAWFRRCATDDEGPIAHAQRVAVAECALAALEERRWTDAETHLRSFRQSARAAGADDQFTSLLGLIAEANFVIRRGGIDRGRELLRRVQPVRRHATWAIPWFAVRCLTELAATQLLAGDTSGACASVAQAEDVLVHRPRLGTLAEAVARVREQCSRLPATAGQATGLTDRELRLLPLLQTYLTFQEIGDRLGVSRNTVKTQAASIYAKLGATSRSEAVEAAEYAGLLVPLLGPSTGDPVD